MIPRKALVLMLALALTAALALSVSAKTGIKADLTDDGRASQVKAFALGPYDQVSRAASYQLDAPVSGNGASGRSAAPVGSAQSAYLGMGVGESVDLTFYDIQWLWYQGRQTVTYSNGSDIVDVHFSYRDDPDTLQQGDDGWIHYRQSGYNVYSAADGEWPRGQEAGCQLQGVDTLGGGSMPDLDLLEDGRVLLAATGRIYGDTLADGSDWTPSMFFFQANQYNCTYNTVPSYTNVKVIDSTDYMATWMDAAPGNGSRDPQVATQWDGTQLITHVLLGEVNMTTMNGPRFLDGEGYHVITYFRGVGSTIGTHTWQTTETQVIDTVFFVWYPLMAAPYPHTGVAVAWTNPSYWGLQLDHEDDNDIYMRESTDRGLNWGPVTNVTEFQNAVANHPDHFCAWLEVTGMYTSDGNLHLLFPARPTSADPYFDNYSWKDFDQNLYHWDQNSDRMVKVANGVFYNDDMLTGSPNRYHCGFGGTNCGYLGYSNIAECDGKVYAIWSQIHERLNMATTNDWTAPENEHLIDDCALNAERHAAANFEIMMSVTTMASPTLWDPARNITNTYTPNCCLPGDEDPDCEGPCGSEWKPMVEAYGHDYSGMTLSWPSNLVDMTPDGEPAYTGSHFLNLAYMDDQWPGPGDWPDGSEDWWNPPVTLNSIKWVRLACVEPVPASLIRVSPRSVEFPEWARTGQTSTWEVTVTNEGNVALNVTEIGFDEVQGPAGWLSTSVSTMVVPAGLTNTGTFDIEVDAAGITVPTWLEAQMYVKSDAQNFDSIGIRIHILAAPHVEPARWDTVFTHADMYDPYGINKGECVGLAVSNMGEMGYGSATGVNLDFEWAGTECGDRDRDDMYLASASPYVLDANASGAEVLGTTSNGDLTQTDIDGWDPYDNAAVPTDSIDMTDELGPGGIYQEVYAGKSISRDTTIIWERWFYGPRDDVDNNSFVGMLNKVYTADGAAHNNITLGVVTDWDVPAADVPNNVSGVSTSGNFTYMQGTDTAGYVGCQSHANRFGTEAFGGWGSYTVDPCDYSEDLYGQTAFFQMLMEDTNLTRLGATLAPQTPDYQAWWDDIEDNPGFNGYATSEDQAIWTTYVHNHNLGGADTLYFWSIYTTVRNGSLADLEAQVTYARNWFKENIFGCEIVTTCCVGHTGDANQAGGDEPTVSDISTIVAALFIYNDPGPISGCMAEADVNQSGGIDPQFEDVTIQDISFLVSYLFIAQAYDPITNPTGIQLPECL